MSAPDRDAEISAMLDELDADDAAAAQEAGQ